MEKNRVFYKTQFLLIHQQEDPLTRDVFALGTALIPQYACLATRPSAVTWDQCFLSIRRRRNNEGSGNRVHPIIIKRQRR
jgi:hypothetical protein